MHPVLRHRCRGTRSCWLAHARLDRPVPTVSRQRPDGTYLDCAPSRTHRTVRATPTTGARTNCWRVVCAHGQCECVHLVRACERGGAEIRVRPHVALHDRVCCDGTPIGSERGREDGVRDRMCECFSLLCSLSLFVVSRCVCSRASATAGWCSRGCTAGHVRPDSGSRTEPVFALARTLTHHQEGQTSRKHGGACEMTHRSGGYALMASEDGCRHAIAHLQKRLTRETRNRQAHVRVRRELQASHRSMVQKHSHEATQASLDIRG